MKRRTLARPAPPPYRIHEWYALVAIYDTHQGGFVWHRQCPHGEVPKAKADAAALIKHWLDDPQLFPMPLDDAFHRKPQQNPKPSGT